MKRKMATPDLSKIKQKFFALTVAVEECLVWIGPVDKDGYGMFRLRMPDGKLELRSHRVAYIFKYGAIPKGVSICHARICCKKESCVNVDHLYAGDNSTNMQDRASFGYAVRGEQNGAAVLNSLQVRVIRFLFWRRNWSQRHIAKTLSISSATVSLVILRKIWKHV